MTIKPSVNYSLVWAVFAWCGHDKCMWANLSPRNRIFSVGDKYGSSEPRIIGECFRALQQGLSINGQTANARQVLVMKYGTLATCSITVPSLYFVENYNRSTLRRTDALNICLHLFAAPEAALPPRQPVYRMSLTPEIRRFALSW